MSTRGIIIKSLACILLIGGIAIAQNISPTPKAAPGRGDAPASAKPAPMGLGTTLFDRVGGTYPVAAMVDDYINQLATDPVVMANPNLKAAIEKAAISNGLPGLKFQITALVIQTIGGPYTYHGRTMKDSHKDLKINQSEWDAGVEVFRGTLNRFHVPAKEQEELIAAIGATHDDIVVGAGVKH